VTVDYVAEAGTKPDSTGTVDVKVSTIHKVAGVSSVSDELLDDSAGLASELVSQQFARAIGILHTAGITSTAADGSTGKLLMDSIYKAIGRLSEDFVQPDTVVLHPRDFVKFAIATDDAGRYLFESGAAGQLAGTGITVVSDANVPITGREPVAIVGDFQQAYLFDRSFAIEASRDAGWVTDTTVFRGVQRFGFGVVQPDAFEVITDIAAA
jgi:HK97 family phage major capsid protein